MKQTDFWHTLNFEDGLDTTVKLLKHFPVLYGGVIGLDGRPKVHPVNFCFSENDALYFAVGKCEMFYGELSQNPYIQICAVDAESGISLQLSGKACFTEEAEIIDRCFAESAVLQRKYGAQKEMPIAYFLTEAMAELTSSEEAVPNRVYDLPIGGEVLIGLQIKKKTELRDRLAKLLEEREAAGADTSSQEALFLQKLYDGALLLAAETAKEQWSRMNIQAIERAVIYETYAEREEFTALARKLIGNVTIEKPEDWTYYLNRETLKELYEKFIKE